MNINVISVLVEINCVKNVNGNIELIKILIIVSIISVWLGKCLLFKWFNYEGNKLLCLNE